MSEKRLFLLDAYALIFRGYYAFIKNPRINSKGFDTSAILGFTNTLMEVLKKEKPTHIAVAFDVGKSTIRVADYPEYKANRSETPEAIKLAVPYIKDILNAFGIPIVFKEGYEADDVIGTISKQAEKQGFMTYMMTSDKDFAQLVTENIKMYKPRQRGGGIEILGIEEVRQVFEVDRPSQVIDYLAMMGDAVDNIPGLPGVGKKTAQKFIKQFGSIENLLENTHLLKGKLKEKIENNKDLGILSKKLATIITDVPVLFDEKDYLFANSDIEKLAGIFKELEMNRLASSVEKLFGVEKPKLNPKPSVVKTAQMSLFDNIEDENLVEEISDNQTLYQVVDTEFSQKLLLSKLIKQQEVSINIITGFDDFFKSDIVGFSFCYSQNISYFVSVKNFTLDIFKEFFENDKINKIAHNIKFIINVLRQNKICLKGDIFDVSVAHYLLNPDMGHNIYSLSRSYLNMEIDSLDIVLKGKNKVDIQNIELGILCKNSCSLSNSCLELKCIFEKEMIDNKLIKIFLEMEMPLIKVLSNMETEGINLDVNFLQEMSKKIEVELSILKEKIFLESKSDFNLDSPKQLGIVLFEKMKLSSNPKKTKTGQYSTSEETLLKLSENHDIIKIILKYRQLQKLQSTYVLSLPNEVKNSGRIHTTFSQITASTGRLSSLNPNIQNIPIRTELGRQVRKAFVPRDENYTILAADYSQIELRIIAELSGDKNMINAFSNGYDIHKSTASKVFGIDLKDVTKQQRSQAKAVNFGIIYGISAFGLSKQISLSVKESKSLIDAYFENYPELKKYMDEQINTARELGFVKTMFGRKRKLNDINSNNSLIRSHAERNAVNTPIQGSASDIIKMAMIKIEEKLKNYKTKMILQIHDELVFDVYLSELESVKAIIKKEMESVVDTRVSMIVDLGFGDNWLEAH